MSQSQDDKILTLPDKNQVVQSLSMSVDDLKEESDRFINREISWLAFNKRVLEEANNQNHPLFERLRFLSIAASNLDEFYMVRVSGIKGQINADISSFSVDGSSPMQQITMIQDYVEEIKVGFASTWATLKKELATEEVHIVSAGDLSKKDCVFINKFFTEDVFPILTPMAIDPAHPFPHVPNKGLAIALQISRKKEDEKKDEKETYEALIILPQRLDRFVRLPGKKTRYMFLEDIVMMNIEKIFPPPVKIIDHTLFRVIRDSELYIDDEAEDLVRTYETALRQRLRGNVIRLTVKADVSDTLFEFLKERFSIHTGDIIRVEFPPGLSDYAALIDGDKQNLLFRPYNVRFPERIRDFGGDCFAAIRNKDIAVHHPYESFNVVIQFVQQAAADPDVVSIKQTLYRTGQESAIAKALIAAAEAGKAVTAVVELKARFDEDTNLKWARDMERAGVQVIYGFVDLKIHAKLSYVVRREGDLLRAYGHFGTGNYHPEKAKIYTDLSYFTCNEDLCHDMALMFNFMTGYAVPDGLNLLRMAPLNLRETLVELIDKEIAFARAGKPASIWMKCNALLDSRMIKKLYEASCAGVQIDLVIRGICALRPGIVGLSENIRVKSIVGRFLEHSRIYSFGNGSVMPSKNAKLFISSADIMERNLDRRIESFVPILNKTVHKQILEQVMVANLKDEKQSWFLQADGSYVRVNSPEDGFCAHDYFMNNPSLSGRGKALDKKKPPNVLSLGSSKRTQNFKQISRQDIDNDLKSIVDHHTAIIDIGSNSVRLVIYENKDPSRAILNEKAICSLGKDLGQTGLLYKKGKKQTLETLAGFKDLMKIHNVDQLKTVATAALRDANDGADFAAYIQEKFDIKVDILSGKEEASFSARGVQAFFPKAKGVMADIGGGSMDMAILEKDNVIDPISMKIGALRLIENEDHIDEFLKEAFSTLPEHYHQRDTIYAVGGSWRVFAESFQRENNIQQPHSHGFMMTAEEVCEHAQFLRAKIGGKPGKLALRYNIEKRRAKVLPYAAVALDALVKHLDTEKVIFSNAGLRDGVLRAML